MTHSAWAGGEQTRCASTDVTLGPGCPLLVSAVAVVRAGPPDTDRQIEGRGVHQSARFHSGGRLHDNASTGRTIGIGAGVNDVVGSNPELGFGR